MVLNNLIPSSFRAEDVEEQRIKTRDKKVYDIQNVNREHMRCGQNINQINNLLMLEALVMQYA